jgi:putative ABC transport system substrate-binding protein
MRRRDVIRGIAGSVAAWPLAARAQQADRVRRVGILMPYAQGDDEFTARVEALKQQLANLGWVQSRNVQFDERWTTDNMDLVRANAASLLAWHPDVVVTIGGRVVPVLVQLSRSVPIVLPGQVDPVGLGLVESLARPGGNITGFSNLELSMFGKILETFKQLAPATARLGLIYNPDNPLSGMFRRTIDGFAGQLAIEPVDFPIHKLADIERALTSLADRPNAGVFFPPDLTVEALRADIIALVGRHHMPAMYSEAIFVKNGGLAFYGVDRIDLYRRAAGYVDRILRGEKPADMPFRQPTKYELMINLKTAKALGITVPQALLTTADEVIE